MFSIQIHNNESILRTITIYYTMLYKKSVLKIAQSKIRCKKMVASGRYIFGNNGQKIVYKRIFNTCPMLFFHVITRQNSDIIKYTILYVMVFCLDYIAKILYVLVIKHKF